MSSRIDWTPIETRPDADVGQGPAARSSSIDVGLYSTVISDVIGGGGLGQGGEGPCEDPPEPRLASP